MMGNWARSQKGQDFERTVCRQLSLWLSGGANANLLWRSSQSGGRATTLAKSGTDLSVQAGDVAAIDPAGDCFTRTVFVECKCIKSLRLDLLLYDAKGELGHMWRKCCEQAFDYCKVPLLVCRENHKVTLCCFPTWLTYSPGYAAVFGNHRLCIGRFSDLLALDVEQFIAGGKSDACAYYATSSPVRSRLRL
jgi:hypothetical protein